MVNFNYHVLAMALAENIPAIDTGAAPLIFLYII